YITYYVQVNYHSYGVSLSKGQLQKLSSAYNNNSAITIRLAYNELSGPDELMLTKTQLNKLKKAKIQGVGSDTKISKTQLRKAIKQGGSVWSSLNSLGTRAFPHATSAISKAVPVLATGAMSALGNLGIDKIFGKEAVGFLIKKGLPYMVKKSVEMGRYYGSEALRNKKLQKKAINYGLKKLTPVIQNVGSEALDQLSTKIRP
ncbi:unnamed protein product, partial [Porites evermanni]